MFFPAFCEEENVGYMLEEACRVADSLASAWEVTVVDDGSTDRTADLVEEWGASEPRIRLVRHPRNLGFGAALQSGIAASRYEWVFYSDFDGQFDLEELEVLWRARSTADVLAGYRRRRRDPLMRLGYSLAYNTLVSAMFFGGYKDVDSSFKLYRRSIFGRVRPRCTCGVIDLEILLLARAWGYRVRQFPVSHRPRRAGTVSFETVRRGVVAWVRLGPIAEMFAQLLSLRRRLASRMTMLERDAGLR
jgi:glycosyltransferase involved in cell wall biosynthesis